MALMSNADRREVWAHIMRVLKLSGLTKTEVRETVDAIDQWAEAAESSYNAALPAKARTTLNAKTKAAMLMLVINKRNDVT